MQLSDRELWLLNFYRNSELNGALLMGRLARSVSDPELITNFTRHCAAEAHHSTLFSELLESIGARFENTVTVQETYAERGGVPKQIADLLVLSEVLEKRVLKTYAAHLQQGNFPATVLAVLRKIVHEMEEEEDGEHAGWIDRRLKLLPPEDVGRAEAKWTAIDAEVASSLAQQLEQKIPIDCHPMNTTTDKIRQIIARVALVPVSEVTDDAGISQLGVSSFDRIECILALEEAFRVELPQEVLETARTVGDLKVAVEAALTKFQPVSAK